MGNTDRITAIEATRYHDISCGHRVFGHESKCAHLHGHNYRIHFAIQASCLDSVGRVLDFSVIKKQLCGWLEEQWDHHFLVWKGDPAGPALLAIDPAVVVVPFNPTAENMAEYLLNTIGPALLPPGCLLTRVVVEETAKCAAVAARRGTGAAA